MSSLDKHKDKFIALLYKWEKLVSRLQSGYNLTIYDYTNSLGVRDSIQKMIKTVPDSVGLNNESIVLNLDEKFYDLTHTISRPLTPSNKALAMWWYRVPNNLGKEIAADLKSNGLIE